jgi:hypothetical protein
MFFRLLILLTSIIIAFFTQTESSQKNLIEKYYEKKKTYHINTLSHNERLKTFTSDPRSLGLIALLSLPSLLASIHNNQDKIQRTPFAFTLKLLGIGDRAKISNFFRNNSLGKIINSSIFKTKNGINYSFLLPLTASYYFAPLGRWNIEKKIEKAEVQFTKDLQIFANKNKLTKEINTLLEDERVQKEYHKHKESAPLKEIKKNYEKKKKEIKEAIQKIEKEKNHVSADNREKQKLYEDYKKKRHTLENTYKKLVDEERNRLAYEDKKNQLNLVKKYFSRQREESSENNNTQGKTDDWVPDALAHFSADELITILEDPSYPSDARGSFHFIKNLAARRATTRGEVNENNILRENQFLQYSEDPTSTEEINLSLAKKNKKESETLFKKFWSENLITPPQNYYKTTEEEKRRIYDLGLFE